MTKHEQTKMILEWCLVFMMMHHDPKKLRRESEEDFPWTIYCMQQANRYPMQSYAHQFWWSLRYWDEDGWIGWRQYLQFKLNQNKIPASVDMEKI